MSGMLCPVAELEPGDVLTYGRNLVIGTRETTGGPVVVKVLSPEGQLVDLGFSPNYTVTRDPRPDE